MTGINYCLPEYEIEERDEQILITIEAPLSRPREAAFVLEKGVFTFDSSPYLLKIKLPHAASDKFSNQAYDPETKTYRIKLKKTYKEVEESSDEEDDNPEISKLLEDHANGEGDDSKTENCNDNNRQYYGFANKYSNMFGKLYNEFSEIISLPEPDRTSFAERRKLRLKEENEKWSDDHYLADTMETDHLESIFEYEPPWITKPVNGGLSTDEKDMLAKLEENFKNKPLSDENKRLIEFQLVDILFAYAYNKRTTEGDNTVESGWTINKLSSTLSWFEEFEDLRTVVVTCYRRFLIYPLYRNWNLTQVIHRDVVNILKLGPEQITRCLLEVIEIFNESENRYLLNTLYLNELCVFSHNISKDRTNELASELEKIKITKYEVNEDIPLLEIAAYLTLEEENSDETNEKVSSIIEKIEKLGLKDKSGEDLSESSDSSDSGDSSESESSESYSSQSSKGS